MSKNKEIQEYYIPFGLAPKYNKECSELFIIFLLLKHQHLHSKIILFQITENQHQIKNHFTS